MRTPRHLRALLTYQNGIALAIALLSGLAFWQLHHVGINLFTKAGFQHAVDRLGIWGPLFYMGILALSVVVSQIPGVPLAIAAGAVWGALPAGIYSVLGGFLGSMIAYFLGRTLGRSAIRAFTGKAIYFSKHRGEYYLGWLIFFTRLFPVFSFDLISYGAGITGLSIPIYAIATLLGMIPPTFLMTYMGSELAMGMPMAIAFGLVFLAVLIVLPWGIQRYNWLGMKEVIRMD